MSTLVNRQPSGGTTELAGRRAACHGRWKRPIAPDPIAFQTLQDHVRFTLKRSEVSSTIPQCHTGAIQRRRRKFSLGTSRKSPASAYGWPGPVNLVNPILVRQVLPEAYMPEKPKPGSETIPPLPAL